MIDKVRIATRKSPLALWQAKEVARRLEILHEGIKVKIIGLTTRGDQILDSPLAKIGGKGLFVKELEHALLTDQADIAVHSMKDVPVEFPFGLGLAAILKREDPRDALVSNRYENLETLPANARIGSSSLRRQMQLAAHFPKFQIKPLRGNVNTRLSKLDTGDFDAIILACAGLKRLGLENRIRMPLPTEISLPAIGQGAMGIEVRLGDAPIRALLAPLEDQGTLICLTAERAMNQRLNGGCQVPIAGFAQLNNAGHVKLRGLVGTPDGRKLYHAEASAPPEAAEALGRMIAERLLAQGADRVLAKMGIETTLIDNG